MNTFDTTSNIIVIQNVMSESGALIEAEEQVEQVYDHPGSLFKPGIEASGDCESGVVAGY